MRSQRIFWYISLGLCVYLFITETNPALQRSLILYGFLPGASSHTVQIAQKSHSVQKGLLGDRHRYWLSWTFDDIRKDSNHRVDVPRKVWENSGVSEPMVLLFAGEDPRPSLKGDPAERGRFALQALLAALEAVGVILSLAGLIALRRKGQ